MYAGESAVYLDGVVFEMEGRFKGALPVPANEHLPVLLSEQTMTLRSAHDVHGLLREMIREMKGEHVPGHIASVVRDAALRSVRDIDTAWASSLVAKFYGVSAPLGLGMEEEGFTAQMEDQLMSSLQSDIMDGPSLHFTPYRIEAVQKSLKTLGLSFTAAHADRITDWAYERTLDVLRLGEGDLPETMSNAEAVISKVDHALRYGA